MNPGDLGVKYSPGTNDVGLCKRCAQGRYQLTQSVGLRRRMLPRIFCLLPLYGAHAKTLSIVILHIPVNFCSLAVFSKFGCFCAVRLLLFSFRYISHNHVPRLNAVLA